MDPIAVPQYHVNLVWNAMWIGVLFANHYKDVIPFKNSKQYKIILSKLVSPGMISTSANSYTVTFTCILYHFLHQSERFSATAEEWGDLIVWRVNTWNTLSSWSQGRGMPDRHIANCWSGYLPDTHPTTQPLGQGRRSHRLQQLYQQFQPEMRPEQHPELGGMRPGKVNLGRQPKMEDCLHLQLYASWEGFQLKVSSQLPFTWHYLDTSTKLHG